MPGRVTVEQLAEAYPGLLDALSGHPGIGAMLIKSEAHGSIVIGHAGINFLEEDRVEGVDPVAQYGGRAREAFLRLDGMDHVPDLSVISLYDPEFDEVAAFEELIGSHGGLGGPQTQPIIMYPAEWQLDEDLVGAPAVYRQIRRWAERHLDHRFGKDGTAAAAADPGASPRRPRMRPRPDPLGPRPGRRPPPDPPGRARCPGGRRQSPSSARPKSIRNRTMKLTSRAATKANIASRANPE